MFNLAFDTTAQSCSVILTKDSVTLYKSVQKMDFGQSEALMPAIKAALDANNLKMKDIDLITVCTGPGSFTGVRSSLSAARTLELALPDIKLTGVSAFEAYIEDIEPDELAEVNAVIIHKKALSTPEALNYEEIIDKLRNHKVTFTGDGVERFLNHPSGLSLHVINMPDIPPIEALARCGDLRWSKKNLDYPKPLYLRAPDVCLKA